MFKNMRLAAKIGGGFAALIIIAVALGGLAVWSMLSVQTVSQRLSEENVPAVKMANDVERSSLVTMYNMRGYGFTDDTSFLAEGRKNLDQVKQAVGQTKQHATQYNRPQIKEAAERAEGKVGEYEKLVNQTVALTEGMDKDRAGLDKAAADYMEACYTLLANQNKAMAADIKAATAKVAGAAEVDHEQKLGERTAKIGLVNEVVDLGNTIRLSCWRAQASRDVKLMVEGQKKFEELDRKLAQLRQITRLDADLRELDSIAQAGKAYGSAMAGFLEKWDSREKLGKQRNSAGEDVLAQAQQIATLGMDDTTGGADDASKSLATASTTMIVGLIVAILVGVVMAIALTRGITRPFQNIFKGLKSFSTAELEQTGETFRRIIDGMTNGSEQVTSAAGQVSAASQSLAEGSSEQAAAIEETSSSIEEMASMTKQNAANANEAKTLAGTAQSGADKGGQAMTRLGSAIDDIKKSADETSKIIKTIDEIAFQTNLLALNAAVEAARAGEAGKGFAVVAEEVRNLAQRSAEAAKNTSKMIEESINNAESGVQISKEATTVFQQIAEGVRKVNELVGEIAAANNEQAQGIEQVNTAVGQMDSVTQQNAANAEETASASEELSAQAEEMNNMVQQLIALVGRSDGQAGGGTPRRKSESAGGAVKHANLHFAHDKPQAKAAVRQAVGRTRSASAHAATAHKIVEQSATVGKRTPTPEEIIPLDSDVELAKF